MCKLCFSSHSLSASMLEWNPSCRGKGQSATAAAACLGCGFNPSSPLLEVVLVSQLMAMEISERVKLSPQCTSPVPLLGRHQISWMGRILASSNKGEYRLELMHRNLIHVFHLDILQTALYRNSIHCEIRVKANRCPLAVLNRVLWSQLFIQQQSQ